MAHLVKFLLDLLTTLALGIRQFLFELLTPLLPLLLLSWLLTLLLRLLWLAHGFYLPKGTGDTRPPTRLVVPRMPGRSR